MRPWGSSWNNDADALGVFLLEIEVGGVMYFFSSVDIDVVDDEGRTFKYEPAIIERNSFSESVDVFSRSANTSQMRFELSLDMLPLDDHRSNGVVLQNSSANVYWGLYKTNDDPPYRRNFIHIIDGEMTDIRIDIQKNECGFAVKERSVVRDRLFPPYAITEDLMAGITANADVDDESVGKAYPVIIGNVKRIPLVFIDGTSSNVFFVAHCPGDTTYTGTTQLYLGDDSTALTISVDQYDTDADGNGVWAVSTVENPTAEADQRNVTADFTGASFTKIGQCIQWLVNNYSDHKDLIDIESLNHFDTMFPGIEVALYINDFIDGGIFTLIRGRIIQQLPAAFYFDGTKHKLLSLGWNDRTPVKTLSLDNGIHEKVGPVMETSKSAIQNDFVFRYEKSLARGEDMGVFQFKPDNHHKCNESALLFGKRAASTVNLGDLVDGIRNIAEWYVETFSKMRLQAKYRCSMYAADLQLWDTVEIIDDDEGWDTALFKVVGIERPSNMPFVNITVLSMDSAHEVFNRRDR